MSSPLETLRRSLAEHRVDAFLISSVPHISYLTGYGNFFIEEREAYLLITKKRQYILTDGRYTEAVKREAKEFELLELGSGKSIQELLTPIIRKEKIQVLGVEENNLTVTEHRIFKRIAPKIKGVFLQSLRIVKESWEIKNIEAACRLGDKTFEYILPKLKTGMTEQAVAWEMEKFVKSQGAKLSFETIVAFGKNASVPHHHTGETKLGTKQGQFILLDFGTKVSRYCSDMTRTVFWGKASVKQGKIYATVREAQEKAAEYIEKNLVRGARADEADRVAREYIQTQGFATIPHSLGHGIGLEVHEPPRLSPRSSELLQDGMVFSIEPGIYLPGFGGVRIEDLFVIEGKRLRQLTKARKTRIEL